MAESRLKVFGVKASRCLAGMAMGAVMVLEGFGCASSGQQHLKGAEAYYQDGLRELERGHCVAATEKLQRLVSNFPGSQLVADAQYYLAESYFCSEDYVNAVFEYQRLVDTYPSSQWVDESQYKIGECYYKQMRRAELDQSEAHDALSYFRIFLDENPDSPLVDKARERVRDCRQRLARKQFLAARLYQRQGLYQAARIYFDALLVDFPDTEYYYRALLRLGEIALAEDDKDGARKYWGEVARDCGDGEIKAQAGKKLREVFAEAGAGRD